MGDWRDRAVCVGTSIYIFFPDELTAFRLKRRQWGEARTYCGRCPVQAQCLAAALAEEKAYDGGVEVHGFRGGTTPDERKAMHDGRKPRERPAFCKNGHPYTEENTYWRKDGSGRACKACNRARYRRKA